MNEEELAKTFLAEQIGEDVPIEIDRHAPRLATLLVRHALEARLDEARWWRVQTHEGAICSPQDCIQCKHVAKLAERASKGAGGGEK